MGLFFGARVALIPNASGSYTFKKYGARCGDLAEAVGIRSIRAATCSRWRRRRRLSTRSLIGAGSSFALLRVPCEGLDQQRMKNPPG